MVSVVTRLPPADARRRVVMVTVYDDGHDGTAGRREKDPLLAPSGHDLVTATINSLLFASYCTFVCCRCVERKASFPRISLSL